MSELLVRRSGRWRSRKTDETYFAQGERDPFLTPFSSNSWANLPIGNNATFVDEPAFRLHTGFDPYTNFGQYSHSVSQAKDSDPMATMVDTVHGNYTEVYRIPADAQIAAGTDGHMEVVSPDGAWVYESFKTVRISSTSYTCDRLKKVDIRGQGIGPQNGVRAFGGSAIAGLIRRWEVDPQHPKYNGKIEHVIAWAFRDNQLLKGAALPGLNASYNGYYADNDITQQAFPGWGTRARGGFMQFGAYVYPATEQDWNSPTNYSGSIPMGAYFALPPNIDITTLGLTPQGLMLARAMQDYGGYVVDRSGSAVCYVEYDADPASPAKAFSDALRVNNLSADGDLRTILDRVQLVTNNTVTNPNGAPSDSSNRRRPLLPEV